MPLFKLGKQEALRIELRTKSSTHLSFQNERVQNLER